MRARRARRRDALKGPMRPLPVDASNFRGNRHINYAMSNRRSVLKLLAGMGIPSWDRAVSVLFSFVDGTHVFGFFPSKEAVHELMLEHGSVTPFLESVEKTKVSWVSVSNTAEDDCDPYVLELEGAEATAEGRLKLLEELRAAGGPGVSVGPIHTLPTGFRIEVNPSKARAFKAFLCSGRAPFVTVSFPPGVDLPDVLDRRANCDVVLEGGYLLSHTEDVPPLFAQVVVAGH